MLELRELRGHVRNDLFVILARSQLQKLREISSFAFYRLEFPQGFLCGRTLAHQLLRLVLIVPETLGQAEIGQPVDRMTKPLEVKGTSPALPCAV
jgi:hypothetical protein